MNRAENEDEGRFRRRGWRTVPETGRRTVPETNPVNRAENENGEQFRRRGWRTKEGDGTEDGFGNED